jgi:SAP domain
MRTILFVLALVVCLLCPLVPLAVLLCWLAYSALRPVVLGWVYRLAVRVRHYADCVCWSLVEGDGSDHYTHVEPTGEVIDSDPEYPVSSEVAYIRAMLVEPTIYTGPVSHEPLVEYPSYADMLLANERTLDSLASTLEPLVECVGLIPADPLATPSYATEEHQWEMSRYESTILPDVYSPCPECMWGDEGGMVYAPEVLPALVVTTAANPPVDSTPAPLIPVVDTPVSWEKMNNATLRDWCDTLALPVSGNKAMLVARLTTYFHPDYIRG